jgi:hypothetical protein
MRWLMLVITRSPPKVPLHSARRAAAVSRGLAVTSKLRLGCRHAGGSVSYDLGIWYQEAPATLDDAARRYDALLDSADYAQVPANRAVAAFVTELLAGYPWSPEQHAEAPSIGDDWVIVTLPYPVAREVTTTIVRLAARHGLVCYDPQTRMVAAGGEASTPQLLLTLADGRRILDPDAERLRRELSRLGTDCWYACLTRTRDDWFVQVGYGPKAGTREGLLNLERQEGGLDRHYQTSLSDLSSAIVAFQAFAAGEQDWVRHFTWRQLQL